MRQQGNPQLQTGQIVDEQTIRDADIDGDGILAESEVNQAYREGKISITDRRRLISETSDGPLEYNPQPDLDPGFPDVDVSGINTLQDLEGSSLSHKQFAKALWKLFEDEITDIVDIGKIPGADSVVELGPTDFTCEDLRVNSNELNVNLTDSCPPVFKGIEFDELEPIDPSPGEPPDEGLPEDPIEDPVQPITPTPDIHIYRSSKFSPQNITARLGEGGWFNRGSQLIEGQESSKEISIDLNRVYQDRGKLPIEVENTSQEVGDGFPVITVEADFDGWESTRVLGPGDRAVITGGDFSPGSPLDTSDPTTSDIPEFKGEPESPKDDPLSASIVDFVLGLVDSTVGFAVTNPVAVAGLGIGAFAAFQVSNVTGTAGDVVEEASSISEFGGGD